ncbi:hypothetical protein [Streptomyces sp. NPDC002889]|uniref:hypothetical protein n=1 Tax=Streptomyces sp. NPDC002889 TaxID=3364669 RepID=UPI0036C22F00
MKTRRWRQTGAALIAAGIVSTGCSQPKSAPSNRPGTAVLDTKQVAAALPDTNAVPPGWTKTKTPQHDDTPQDTGRTAHATAGYHAPDLDGTVTFSISSFHSTTTATEHLTFSRTQYDSGVAPLTLPGTDQAFSTHGCLVESLCNASIHAQVGTTVISINIDTNTHNYHSPDPQTLNTVTRMQITRIQQTQQGKTPTATTP